MLRGVRMERSDDRVRSVPLRLRCRPRRSRAASRVPAQARQDVPVRLHAAGGTLAFWFQVNPKASAIPHQPGEFRPSITAPDRGGDHDDATVSWYQYADEAMTAAFLAQQVRVRDHVAAQTEFELDIWREQRDVSLRTMQAFIDLGLRPAVLPRRIRRAGLGPPDRQPAAGMDRAVCGHARDARGLHETRALGRADRLIAPQPRSVARACGVFRGYGIPCP
jgi:hypothetical protein